MTAAGCEIDVERNLARLGFAGRVSAADVKAWAEAAERRLPQLRAGFSVLVDLSGLQRMDLDFIKMRTEDDGLMIGC